MKLYIYIYMYRYIKWEKAEVTWALAHLYFQSLCSIFTSFLFRRWGILGKVRVKRIIMHAHNRKK